MVLDRNANLPAKIVKHFILIIFSLFCILPFLLVVSSSFMHEKDIFISGYTYFPKAGFTTAAYWQIFLNPRKLLNGYMVTIFSTFTGTLLGLWLTLTLGYIISRRDFKLRKPISFYVFFTMIFNGGLVPTYIMLVSWFRLGDSIILQIVPYLCLGLNVLIAKGFFQTITPDIIESANLDGAGEFRTFFRIILPVSKPAVATVGLFIAFNYWNDWYQSYIYINSINKVTLQYLLVEISENITFLQSDMSRYLGASAVNAPAYTARMAMCVLAAAPILIVFPFVQKFFEKGLTIGSVKG